MFRKIKKVFCCSMILSLVVSSLAFAASLPNYYGKNYTYTKSKTITTISQESWKRRRELTDVGMYRPG